MNKLISPSWDEIYMLSIDLAEKIVDDRLRFDLILAISRGGLVPARILSDLLEIKDIAIVRAQYYEGMRRKDEPQVSTFLYDTKEKSVLIVDDLADTGKTLSAVLRSMERCRLYRTATIYKKPHSEFIPDYYIKETDAWVIFPWDRYESLKILRESKFQRDPIIERLLRLMDKRSSMEIK